MYTNDLVFFRCQERQAAKERAEQREELRKQMAEEQRALEEEAEKKRLKRREEAIHRKRGKGHGPLPIPYLTLLFPHPLLNPPVSPSLT